MDIKIGDQVKVYDHREWMKIGHDLNCNEHCWKDAIVENIRYNVKQTFGYICPVLYDVIFLHDNFHSHGHFPSAIQEIQ
jgi:hypothetical protein